MFNVYYANRIVVSTYHAYAKAVNCNENVMSFAGTFNKGCDVMHCNFPTEFWDFLNDLIQ